MTPIFKYFVCALTIVATMISCKKYETTTDGAANTVTAAAGNLSLNNRILAGFIIDSSTLPSLQAGLLPVSYNRFRKLLTYDTVAVANRVPTYTAGNVITIVGFLKGDDFAISKGRINVSLFRAPTTFITPANPPSIVNVLQRAEDSYRSYQPGAQTGRSLPTATPPNAPIFSPVADTIFSLPTIASTITAPFNLAIVLNESNNGINSNTYLVQLTFTIPTPSATKFAIGSVYSINLNTGGSFGFLNPTEVLGNVNWIYAFRIR